MMPLHCAALNGHQAIAKLLLEKGADLSLHNNEGDTPLLCAAKQGHEALVKLFKQYS
jgi:ankyrin repeat protein